MLSVILSHVTISHLVEVIFDGKFIGFGQGVGSMGFEIYQYVDYPKLREHVLTDCEICRTMNSVKGYCLII